MWLIKKKKERDYKITIAKLRGKIKMEETIRRGKIRRKGKEVEEEKRERVSRFNVYRYANSCNR